MANRLSLASSPYLLQHKDNPVDWQQWGPEALAEARARNVPVLLSIGYAACHWCHVMAHESFENAETASVMNRLFVNIKVDREERPDIDTLYQQALAVLGQHGGWPLTMFLTPAGEPFWGGTYFPPEPRWGRPSFLQAMERIASLWNEDRDKIDANRHGLATALARLAKPEPGAVMQPSDVIATAKRIAQELDPINGGIGGAPKFPQAPALNLLWQVALYSDDQSIRQNIVHTLSRLCQGGIYDHLGGGFSRYSVDAQWLVPHFEKMLYDNAQLLELLGEAWIATRDPLFQDRAAETYDWLQREMRVAGAYAASLDADSEGEEGRFYVWREAEIDRLLGPQSTIFKASYNVSSEGNWEGTNVLNRLHEAGLPPAEEAAGLAASRTALFLERERRPRPALDDKLLTDWNGLMIAALARTGQRFGYDHWVAAARQAFDAIIGRMSSGEGLAHSWRDGRRLDLGFLDDYAQMVRASLALHEATGDCSYLTTAIGWLQKVDNDLADGQGAYYLTPAKADLVVRPRNAHDGPTPAAAGTIALESARLFALTGDAVHDRRCLRLLTAFGGEMKTNPFAHATLLQAALMAAAPLQVAILGDRSDAAWQTLWRTVLDTPLPGCVLSSGPAQASNWPADHPFTGKQPVDGRPTAYVCIGSTCLAPAMSAEELALRLADAARMRP